MQLSELKPGQTGVITKVLGHGAFRKRVMEMGFVRGREIKVVLNAPLQDPVKYALMGYEVSLRRAEANLIEVELLEDWQNREENAENLPEVAENDECNVPVRLRLDKIINVALIGNPNCGKTSLFNHVSGAREHVGNYAGVTVGAKEGHIRYHGYHINIVDLPGTYSLSAYSPEELYVMRYLRQETPDVIINVVVSSNMERNLYLTTELIDLNLPMVMCLNMYDELKKSGIQLDHDSLGKMLGVPIVPTIAATGWGVEDLLERVIEVYEMRNPVTRHIHIRMNPVIESAVGRMNREFKSDPSVTEHISPRFMAIKYLEHDPEIESTLRDNPSYPRWEEMRREEEGKISASINEDVASAISADKYGFVQGALRETMSGGEERHKDNTKLIDAVVTSKLFGFPLFIAAMWLMFWATFKLGSYPMGWIESLVGWISGMLDRVLSDGPLKDMLLDGVIGGVGGVIVFLPNILILYAFISFMEDSGYMARVAFIMDRLMHKMGLHGKSFIPMIMGFGCNVPAVMSTRIIESKSSRLITILINPFMSCSARIPIYVLLAGAFFPQYGAVVFVGLYLLGILVAALTARLMRKVWFKKDETPFVMELPPYRVPTLKATMRNMWSKADQYLRKMGGLILVASIIIWALSYFPHYDIGDIPADYRANIAKEMAAIEVPPTPEELDAIATSEYQQEHSILGRIGKAIEPTVRPLGFEWQTSVSLMAGAAAKETVVSTLGVLYGGENSSESLVKRLQTPSQVTGKAPFTAASAMAFMVFVLLYFPCIATLAAIKRETESWGYTLFAILYNTGLAWILAWITYRIASMV